MACPCPMSLKYHEVLQLPPLWGTVKSTVHRCTRDIKMICAVLPIAVFMGSKHWMQSIHLWEVLVNAPCVYFLVPDSVSCLSVPPAREIVTGLEEEKMLIFYPVLHLFRMSIFRVTLHKMAGLNSSEVFSCELTHNNLLWQCDGYEISLLWRTSISVQQKTGKGFCWNITEFFHST